MAVASSNVTAPPGRSKPKQALNAYNIFFQYERERILEELSPGSPALSKKKTPITPEEVREICRQHKLRSQTKRSHRKVHGKISFRDLAKTIADRWRALNTADKTVLEAQAAQELRVYHDEVRLWEQEQEENQNQEQQQNTPHATPRDEESSLQHQWFQATTTPQGQQRQERPHFHTDLRREQQGTAFHGPFWTQETVLLPVQEVSSFWQQPQAEQQQHSSGIMPQDYLKDLTKLKQDVQTQIQACMMKKGMRALAGNDMMDNNKNSHEQMVFSSPFASMGRDTHATRMVIFPQQGQGQQNMQQTITSSSSPSFMMTGSGMIAASSSSSALLAMMQNSTSSRHQAPTRNGIGYNGPYSELDDEPVLSIQDEPAPAQQSSSSCFFLPSTAGLVGGQHDQQDTEDFHFSMDETEPFANDEVPFFDEHEMELLFEG